MQKFSIKQAVCAAAVAVACSGASAATTTDLGLLDIGIEPNSFGGGAAPGTFQDIFTFILPPNGGQGYSVVNFTPNIPGLDFKTIFASISLVSNPDGILYNADDVSVKSALSTDLGKSIGMSWNGSTAGGNMYLLVQGLASGATGGIYSGGISVSPVPEPEAWAMMLVGAGLVGFRLRNRSKKSAAQRFA